MQTVAEVISSGLVPRLVPHLDLSDLQSLVNVDRTLRKLLDTLAEPDWAGIRARIVPSGHYLVGVTSGQTRALVVRAAWSSWVVTKRMGASRPTSGNLPILCDSARHHRSTLWNPVSSPSVQAARKCLEVSDRI